jgi:hypothetical protein
MLNDVQRESLAFVESCMTLSGCDRDVAEDAWRELADATVGTPCPLYRAKQRFLDRLQAPGIGSATINFENDTASRVRNALNYARSFMTTVKGG